MAEPGVVLVVEDQVDTLYDMRATLEEAGHTVLTASTFDAARRILAEEAFDLAFLDISLDGDTERTPMAARGGFRLYDAFRQVAPGIPIVFMTGERSPETIRDLMIRGAYDYLTKPMVPEVLLSVANLAIELGRARRNLAGFRAAQQRGAPDWYVGNTAGMRRAAEQVALFAPTDHHVLILGETGTGKQVVAKAIHAQSTRAAGPFVPVNCATISRELAGSKLFGHVKGAFTGATDHHRGHFEEASGGTLFLDEIGDMPLDLQPQLLQAVQDGTIRPVGASTDRKVDCRIIAATNLDVRQAVQDRRFREDLFFRLGLDPIELPPLRERVPDIPYLATLFLLTERAKNPRVPGDFTERAQRALMAHRWPGNTRELERTVQLAALYAQDEPAVDLAHLRIAPAAPTAAANGHGAPPHAAPWLPADLPAEGIDLPALRDAWEERMVRQALARTHGNQTAAAAILGMSRDMLRTRADKLAD